jgi:undecaprenyl-diphosphatase
MDFLTIILLGLTQGITEWIPISSKTQVTAVYLKILNGDPNLVIPILLYVHMGTVIAATLYFRNEIMRIFADFMRKPMDLQAHSRGKLGFLFTSLLFTGIVGIPLLLLEKKMPSLDAGLLFVLMGAGLLVTGLLLLMQKGLKERKADSVNWLDGVFTGILQGFSILPGISRAGTSTTALIWRGFDSESSFHLSFLLSIPTVILAELVLYVGGLSSFPVWDGILLAVSSFIFGYLVLDVILRVVKKVNMAYVAFALGIIIIAVGLLGMG